MERVLFVRAGALGDLVVTLPVLDALRRSGAQVDVACAPRFAPLVARSGPPELDHGGGAPVTVRDVGGLDMAWAFGGVAPEPWDRAVAFSRSWGEALRAAGIPVVRWVEAVPKGPAVRWFAGVLEGEPVEPPRLRSAPAPALGAPDPALDAPDPAVDTVVLAPGAGAGEKRQPLAWWGEVAAALEARGQRVLWVGGPGERGEAWPGPRVDLDLDATIDLAARCRAWIGPDSGPSHLAAAARRGAARNPTDVLVIFGPTDPAVWAPEGATVRRGQPSVAEVVAFVAARRAWG